MSKADLRRLVIYQVRIVDGELVEDYAGGAIQDAEGVVRVDGLWSKIIPISSEDVRVQASQLGVSPLEWFRTRLHQSALVRVEVMQ